MTPPDAPKILPAVERSPNGVSAFSGSMPIMPTPLVRKSCAASRVVRTKSTSGK